MDWALKRRNKKHYRRISIITFTVCIIICAGQFIKSKGYFIPFSPAEIRHAYSNSGQNFTIQLQPFDDISSDKINYVLKEIKKVYSNTIVLKPVKLPARAFYKPRNRYRADTLIAWLSRHSPDNFVTIGLTSKDVSTNKDQYVDWGVMGLGYCPGNACVVSTFRLSKTNLLDQVFKVAIHELGHTQGLPHCDVKTCYMRDAEGHNTTDEENEFCPKCRKLLEGKGWIFK